MTAVPAAVSLSVVLWALFVSWVLHDLEEVAFLHTRPGAAPEHAFGDDQPSRTAFLVAVAIVGVIVFAATVAGVRDPFGTGGTVYGVVLGGYLLHGVVHLVRTLRARAYTPGVVTAGLLVVPVALFVYWRALAAGMFSLRTAAVLALVGLAAFVPIVLAARRIGDAVT